jgi:hypothetical protein
MKYLKIISISLIALFILSNCKQEKADLYYPHNKNISYNGRVDHQLEEVILIGSASSATMYFTGDTCLVYLQNNNPNGTHNYFSIELDNEDIGRFKIESDTTVVFPIEITFEKEVHKIVVTKSTEAANGYINFKGIFCYELVEPLVLPKKTIEFIGNSITCGMSNDTIDIPCGKGIWYDQHNAYWAYGPTVSRALKVNSYLSSVSGIGMYRNWNGHGPTMPEVYYNLYLN